MVQGCSCSWPARSAAPLAAQRGESSPSRGSQAAVARGRSAGGAGGRGAGGQCRRAVQRGRCSAGGAAGGVARVRHSSLLVAVDRALRCAALRAVCGAVRRTRDSTITAAIGMTIFARSRLAAGGASARSHLQLM